MKLSFNYWSTTFCVTYDISLFSRLNVVNSRSTASLSNVQAQFSEIERTNTKDEKDTINNLKNLYVDQNKMIKVEIIFWRASIEKLNELSTLSFIVRRFVIFVCCLYILFSFNFAEIFRDDQIVSRLHYSLHMLHACFLYRRIIGNSGTPWSVGAKVLYLYCMMYHIGSGLAPVPLAPVVQRRRLEAELNLIRSSRGKIL